MTACDQHLEYVAYLLNAALEEDARRRWWQPPNRLWVGRVAMALRMLERRLEDSA